MAYTVCKEEQRKNRKRGQAEKMKYEHITEGRFIDRPNRFIAHVEINGQVETVHGPLRQPPLCCYFHTPLHSNSLFC